MIKKIIILAVTFSFLPFLQYSSAEKESDKEKIVQEVLEKSGINQQVKEIPNIVKTLVQSQLAIYNATAQPEIILFIEKNLYKYFNDEEMLRIISKGLNENFNRSNIEALLKWFNSNLGKKITELEVKATNPEAAFAIIAYSSQIKTNPPDKKRLELVERMKKTLDLQEHTAKKTCAIFLEMSKGMNESLPAKRRIPDEKIYNMNNYMQKFLAEQIGAYLVTSFLYTYEPLTNDELEKYVDFLCTVPAKWLMNIYLEAFISAIEECSLKFGNALGKEIAKIPPPPQKKKLTWQKYTSIDNTFSMEFPGEPRSEKETLSTEIGFITLHMLYVEINDMTFVLTWVNNYPPLVENNQPEEVLLNNMIKGSASNVGGEIVEKKIITHQGHPGIEYMVRMFSNSGLIRSKIIFVGEKYYHFMITGQHNDVVSKENLMFFNSFSISKNNLK